MAHYKNEDLQNRLKARAEELKKTLTAGDKTVPYQLLEEFRGEFLKTNPERPDTAIYQMICYYLRPPNDTGRDRRKIYSKTILSQLLVMTPKARGDYADRTGRSLRAVNAAIERFRAAEEEKAAVSLAVEAIKNKIADQGFFDISNLTHLKAQGLTRADVVNVRNELDNPFGLALRAPNILYHAPSKRRYYMTTTEQTAIIEDPKKFLKGRVEHIKQNWVIEDLDPIDAVTEEVKPAARRGYPVDSDGAVDLTKPRLKPNKTVDVIEDLIKRLENTEVVPEGSRLFDALTRLYAQVLGMLPVEQEERETLPNSQRGVHQ